MLLVLLIFLFLLFFGMPVAFSIGISGVVFFLTTPEIPMSIIVQRVLAPTQSFTLLAIPLFIFAGNLMNNTGITKRLIKLADVLTGHMYGNLAQVSVVLSTLMGGVSGSAVADAAMESRILGPDMIKRGYSRGYGGAINGISSLITATIPPSMGLIIYGAVGEVSVGRLFAGGIVPGILMMIALMTAVAITAKKKQYMPDREKSATTKEVIKAFIDGIWALIFPIILIVGIRFGVFTPSESGAFAAMYAIFVGVVVYKELTMKKFIKTIRDSSIEIGGIMLIIAVSGIFGYGIVYGRVAQNLSVLITGITTNPLLLFGIIIIALMIAGMFIETTVVALLLTPIFLPIITSVGIDPVHFGLVMMSVTTLGIMTPPLGVALFTVSSIMGCPPEETVKEAVPFFIAVFVVVAIMVFFPSVVLFIPNMIFGA